MREDVKLEIGARSDRPERAAPSERGLRLRGLVGDVHRAWVLGERAADVVGDGLEDGPGERVVQEEDDRAGRDREGRRVALVDRRHPAPTSVVVEVLRGQPGQLRVELDADDRAETRLDPQHDDPPLAAAVVHHGEFARPDAGAQQGRHHPPECPDRRRDIRPRTAPGSAARRRAPPAPRCPRSARPVRRSQSIVRNVWYGTPRPGPPRRWRSRRAQLLDEAADPPAGGDLADFLPAR